MWTMSKACRVLPAALAVSLAAGVLVSTACSARIYTTRSGPSESIERRAYDNGYRQGLDDGRDDARHNRSFSFERHDEYRKAERGYRRQDGERDPYRAAFRRGFEVGYREAFDRFDRERDRR
jgi:hypothetical protein